MREAENGATAGKTDLAKRAKAADLMQSMIQFMRWLAMKLDMVKHLKDYLRDTSAKTKLATEKLLQDFCRDILANCQLDVH